MKGLLKFITCGSVDDGKSTLIGHILYDSKLLYADQEKALELDSKVGSREGKIDYSLLLDGLMAEREQGITIDVAYRYFTTDNRSFIVADTPGHEEYTRNMAVGASFADLAVILVDAKQGVLIQTKRHARICALMGIKHFVFAVNKMDLVGYSEERFNEINAQIAELTKELSLADVVVIPVSATEGDNVTTKSANIPWYKGEALLPYLEQIDVDDTEEEIECAGCAESMVPDVDVLLAHSELKIRTDSDGEERVLAVEAMLELEIRIYEEEEVSLLLDVYTPAKELRVVCKPAKLECLLVKNFSKCRVGERLKTSENQGKILQICHSDGMVKVDNTHIMENGIEIEGIVTVKILYIISDDEMPFYSMDAMIPFSHIVEAQGIGKECIYHLHTDLEQLSTTMIDSDEIEVKIVLNLNALVMKQRERPLIYEIEEQELDREKLQSMPGIVGYQVQPQDTMWDIAKKFYTTTEEIIRLNHLESEELHPFDTLILVKSVESK